MPDAARPDTRLTIDDFMLFPDDGRRHELLDGEHVVTPSPSTRHQRTVQALHVAFALHLRQHPEQGEVFIAPFDVVLSRFDVVEPDLLVVGGGQPDILTEKNVQGPPVLLVEVASGSTRRRDQGAKRLLYERAGVLEYWLVDPDARMIRILRRADAAFTLPTEVPIEAGATLTTPLFQGFALPLGELVFPNR
jgi:Uma2 family endonuclease